MKLLGHSERQADNERTVFGHCEGHIQPITEHWHVHNLFANTNNFASYSLRSLGAFIKSSRMILNIILSK